MTRFRFIARGWNTAYAAALARRERRIPYWPPSRLERLQRRRIASVLRYAHAKIPFYRDTMEARGLQPGDLRTADELARLPLVDGSEVAADPDRFVALPFRARGREVFYTSGSSSHLRKKILWDHGSLIRRMARGERDRTAISRLAGERWHETMLREFATRERGRRLARWLGVPSEGHDRLLILPADFTARTQRAIWSERTLVPRKAMHYHHLAPTAPFEVAADRISALRPRVVFSFGSYADQFFRFLSNQGLAIPLPRVWVYVGDMVSPLGRELAEERGCALYSVYGAVEAGTIGFQCERRGGFHLNVDLVAVRVIDEEGRTLPRGCEGELVISALDNRATILLNYRTGDRGVLGRAPCACGRTLPVLERLVGRVSEAVELADGRRLSSLTLEGLFRDELRRTIQAQVEAVGPGILRWRIVPGTGVPAEALRDDFLRRARAVLGADTKLEVEPVAHIPRAASGKFPRSVRSPDAPSSPASPR